jgi:hypothetical protein
MTDRDYTMTNHDQHSRRTRQRDGSPYRTRKELVMLMACTLILCFLAAPVLSISSASINPGITIKPGCTKPTASITNVYSYTTSPCQEWYVKSGHLFTGRGIGYQASSSGATSWKWDFGDGTTQSGYQVSGGTANSYSQAGKTYTVTYTATNACGSASDTRTVTIQPASTGDIYLVSTPADAWNNAVWEDGSASPATGIRSMLAAPAGKVYTIKINQYGYEPFERTVVAKGGDFVCVEANLVLAGSQQASTTTPTTAAAQATTASGTTYIPPVTNPTQSGSGGSLFITSTPSGAAVFIDSNAEGVTPATLTAIAPGAHTVLLKKNGYPDYTTSTAVVAGQVTTINADLAKGPQAAATNAPAVIVTTASIPGEGSLSVSTTPQGAQVFVDGVVRGMTPATIPGLPAGQHTVLLKLDGYQEFNTTVSIPDGRTAEFTTALAKTQKSPGYAGILAVLGIAALCLFRKRRV